MELDLNKIEEELEKINTLSIIERNDAYCHFVKEAPERISALVKEVRVLQGLTKKHIEHIFKTDARMKDLEKALWLIVEIVEVGILKEMMK